MSNPLAVIRAREAEISDVPTEVIGILGDSRTRFRAVELYVAGRARETLASPASVRESAASLPKASCDGRACPR